MPVRLLSLISLLLGGVLAGYNGEFSIRSYCRSKIQLFLKSGLVTVSQIEPAKVLLMLHHPVLLVSTCIINSGSRIVLTFPYVINNDFVLKKQ